MLTVSSAAIRGIYIPGCFTPLTQIIELHRDATQDFSALRGFDAAFRDAVPDPPLPKRIWVVRGPAGEVSGDRRPLH